MINSKKIINNTIYLYIRTIIIIIVSLFSSRLVLDALGITDWGIYSVVGGFVSIFAFMNTSMTVATQRFITYELGENKTKNIHKVFCQSINIHFLIGILTLLIIEIAGCYFIYNKMNIPMEKIEIAFICFQFSSITMLLEIMKVPFNATIIAYEKMSAFAYLDILYNIVKLTITLSLYLFCTSNRLIIYSASLCCLTAILLIIYALYCRSQFSPCKYEFIWDSKLFKKMLSFASWISFSAISVSLRDQCINILFNIFIGVWINAAYAVSQQVHSTIYKLVHNLQISFSSQLTKSIATNEKESANRIVQSGSKFSIILFTIFFIPVLLKIDYVLSLWLVEIPPHTGEIIKYLLANSLIMLFSASSTTTIRAQGKIAKYEIIINLINILTFIITYLTIRVYNVYQIPFLFLIISSIAQTFIIIKMACKILNTSYKLFIYNVIIKFIYAFVPTYITAYALNSIIPNNIVSSITIIIMTTITLGISSYILYLNDFERLKVINIIKKWKEKKNLNNKLSL